MISDSEISLDGKVEGLVRSILDNKDQQGALYINKYSIEWIVEMLNGKKLAEIEMKFKEYNKKGVDIVDFVKILLSSFDHSQNETIYIVLQLVDIFKNISETIANPLFVRFKDFTDFIVDVMPNMIT